jgi:hypothetical protein
MMAMMEDSKIRLKRRKRQWTSKKMKKKKKRSFNSQ